MMNNVREFWLENQDGNIWRFTDRESSTFLESPQGLGISNNYGGFRLGNAEIVNFIQSELTDIEGVLDFIGTSRELIYKSYFEFMEFIAKNSLLKLHYRSPNTFESYYRYVFVKQITKTEIDSGAYIMRCQVVFATQTFWRNDNRNYVAVTNEISEEGKSYALKRPYFYSYNDLQNIKVYNRGTVETAMKIKIQGATKDPVVYVYDNRGIRYGVIKFIGEFDEIIIDSDDLNQNITLIKDGAILTAPYSYQDLSVGSANEVYVTFVKLKSGDSTLRFQNDGTFTGSVVIEWSDEYVSV